MQTTKTVAAGTAPLTSDEAPAVGAARGFRDQADWESTDFHASGVADQAALLIEGEAYATAYLDRLHDGMVQPGDLATVLSFLSGEMLHGACRAIEKALEGQHHA